MTDGADSLLTVRWRDRSFVLRAPEQVGELARRLGQKDLARIALQEERLRFERFDAGIAWQIGSWLRNTAVSRGQSIAIDITLNAAPLFYCALVGATPNNAEWIRRKSNTVARFHRSSYAIGLELQAKGSNLLDTYGLPVSDFAWHGGSTCRSRSRT